MIFISPSNTLRQFLPALVLEILILFVTSSSWFLEDNSLCQILILFSSMRPFLLLLHHPFGFKIMVRHLIVRMEFLGLFADLSHLE